MKQTTLPCILSIVALLITTGCRATYHRTDMKSLATPLDPLGAVVISVPANGKYCDVEYKNSGEMTAAAIRAAFVRHASDVVIKKDCRTIDCVRNLESGKFKYYVQPTILHWEERATEWSGKPDRINIQIIIYDVTSGMQIGNSSYTGRSKWATLGGDHPQDLLPDPTQQFVDSLYRE